MFSEDYRQLALNNSFHGGQGRYFALHMLNNRVTLEQIPARGPETGNTSLVKKLTKIIFRMHQGEEIELGIEDWIYLVNLLESEVEREIAMPMDLFEPRLVVHLAGHAIFWRVKILEHEYATSGANITTHIPLINKISETLDFSNVHLYHDVDHVYEQALRLQKLTAEMYELMAMTPGFVLVPIETVQNVGFWDPFEDGFRQGSYRSNFLKNLGQEDTLEVWESLFNSLSYASQWIKGVHTLALDAVKDIYTTKAHDPNHLVLTARKLSEFSRIAYTYYCFHNLLITVRHNEIADAVLYRQVSEIAICTNIVDASLKLSSRTSTRSYYSHMNSRVLQATMRIAHECAGILPRRLLQPQGPFLDMQRTLVLLKEAALSLQPQNAAMPAVLENVVFNIIEFEYAIRALFTQNRKVKKKKRK